MYFDRGDEKLTYIRQQGQQMEIECKAESIKIETKMEAEPKENGDEQGANEFGVWLKIIFDLVRLISKYYLKIFQLIFDPL